jgi:predicted HicB family RNase H-like nuclease
LTSPIIIVILVVTPNIKEGYMNLFVKDFPDDLHREAKIYAATNAISLKELVIRALREYLKKHRE